MNSVRSLSLVLVVGTAMAMSGIASGVERQITHDDAFHHELDNNDNFSADDRFL